ncbi:hypothetical protein AK812_SmicGene2203 [Symbiodinium microadriaticum]|uniref:Uncharacterized protein n=1 Tax=Symbiodinium microadriaticum TaxID=2951 RepID=A0A1Q9F233_SYMMI|nr:hypothetical protein AK812_SmicGene2203 [Symbiodinium microadriaticum]
MDICWGHAAAFGGLAGIRRFAYSLHCSSFLGCQQAAARLPAALDNKKELPIVSIVVPFWGYLLGYDSDAFSNIELFHNDAINECGEGVLKHDLKEVLEMQYRGHFFAKVEDEKRNDFGIVEFPFILTPVSKVRMLSIESLLLQREEDLVLWIRNIKIMI